VKRGHRKSTLATMIYSAQQQRAYWVNKTRQLNNPSHSCCDTWYYVATVDSQIADRENVDFI
jgi:hypothetical protein